jgi:hypothetical protein
MSLLARQQLIESFQAPTRPKVARNDQSYIDMYNKSAEDLVLAIDAYKDLGIGNNIKHRLGRDRIDSIIKRYQRYCITENIRSHYIQKGISLHSKDVTVEHVIPEQTIREMLLTDLINIEQALNSPICRVSRQFDKSLRKAGLVKMTPNAWFFFQRYASAAESVSIELSEFETFNGQKIDTKTWNLFDHCRYFNISVL